LALTYATSYDFGSEALAYFMMLWDRVLANDVKLPQSVIDQSLQIVQFASGTKTPLIVQLDSVPGSILSAENGGPTTPIFERIETYVSGPLFLFRSMCQQANFELHQPVPISEAKVFRLVKDSSSQQEQFSLVPYHSTLVPGRNCSSEHERRWMRSEFGSWAEI
jgi:hypothetical protein